jgi:hypothetical protein
MEDFTSKKHILLQLGVLSVVLFLACIQGIPQNPAREIAAQQSPNGSQRSGFPSYPNLGLIATDPLASEVWKQFSKDGRYRVGSKEEFKISEEKYHPYGDGDFNGDHEYHDFAAIVVDTMRTDASRFGIVIFNSRDGRQGYDGPFWLKRESDLSRAALGTSSHGPLLVAEHRDGTIKVCVVKWNLKQKAYRCDNAR